MRYRSAEKPKVVLVPPLFTPLGVTGRSRCAQRHKLASSPGSSAPITTQVPTRRALQSSYKRLFSDGPAKQLLEHWLPNGATSGRLLLTPPGSSDLVVSALVVAADAPGQAAAGRVALRWQPDPLNPSSFVEIKSGGAAGVALRAAAAHHASGLGVFGEASSNAGLRLGVRLAGEVFGSGFIWHAPGKGAPSVEAWAIGRAGRLTFGLESRPPRVAEATLPPGMSSAFAFARQNGFAAALAVRSAPPGRSASFSAVLDVDSQGTLGIAFLQHMAVRRLCRNPFEDDSVAGITNYLDIGIRTRVQLFPQAGLSSSDDGRAEAGEQPFELGLSWQVNSAVLVKARVGTHGAEVAGILKNWWNPSSTAALSLSKTRGAEHARFGLALTVENVGVPVFERADPNQIPGGRVRSQTLFLTALCVRT